MGASLEACYHSVQCMWVPVWKLVTIQYSVCGCQSRSLLPFSTVYVGACLKLVTIQYSVCGCQSGSLLPFSTVCVGASLEACYHSVQCVLAPVWKLVTIQYSVCWRQSGSLLPLLIDKGSKRRQDELCGA